MRFSIRGMLAATLVVALALVLAMRYQQMQRQQAETIALHNEISALEQQMSLGNPRAYEATQHQLDALPGFQASGEAAKAKFAEIRERYSTIEPRADTVSLRLLPTLGENGATAPVEFRVVIPESRPTWLKIGVRLEGHDDSPGGAYDSFDKWISDSPLSRSGPFQIPLGAGDHCLIFRRNGRDELTQVEVLLDDQVVLRTVCQESGMSFNSSSNTAPGTQYDLRPQRKLPWLFSTTLNPDEDNTDEDALSYRLEAWLSDEPSEFLPLSAASTGDQTTTESAGPTRAGRAGQ